MNDEVSQMRLGKVSVSAARRIDAGVGAAAWHASFSFSNCSELCARDQFTALSPSVLTVLSPKRKINSHPQAPL